MEHITTEQGVAYAQAGGPTLAATITTHHLILNRNHILAGSIRPHYYCLPVAKREKHRLAIDIEHRTQRRHMVIRPDFKHRGRAV